LNCGLGSQDDPVCVIENRAKVSAALGGSFGGVVTMHQVHSATAVVITAPIARASLPKADGVVTRTRGLVIGALAADCAPVLFADGEAGVVGAAHAGWRGALGGIVEATVKAMVDLGARREHIRAAVGPCIGPAAYEVGTEFKAQFLAQDARSSRFFMDGPDKPHFDLPAYVLSRILAAGVGHADRVAPCTFANESEFFSFRRSQRAKEPDYGRHISAIVLA
jgi:YfiH family protein